MESQLIGDRINLAMKKSEVTSLSNKLKELQKQNSEFKLENILDKTINDEKNKENRLLDLI